MPLYLASSFFGYTSQYCSRTGDGGSYFEFNGSQYHWHLSPKDAGLYSTLGGLWAQASITLAVLAMLSAKGIDSVNSGGTTLTRDVVGTISGAVVASAFHGILAGTPGMPLNAGNRCQTRGRRYCRPLPVL